VKDYTYHFEIKDLLTQFAAAFDDVVIKRYNKNREPEQSISVRYVLAPKQRVMYDIVNKAQNLTLPVVAMNVTSIARDNNRVFNKLDRVYNYTGEKSSTSLSMPVPINIEVSVSILSRYMQDMDQILSNFIPYANPYVIIIQKEPNNTQDTVEVRTEVNWNGNITMTSPTDTTYSDKFRIIADTSFTIKGWLFKDANTLTPPIYNIRFNSINLLPEYNLDSLNDGNNYDVVVSSLSSRASTISLSGTPVITDLFFFTGGDYLRVLAPNSITGRISSIGDSYGAGGTYGRGSGLGTDYGPGGNYTSQNTDVLKRTGSEVDNIYDAFNFPINYSSGIGTLTGGGNYLITGDNFLRVESIVLSASNISYFFPTIFIDIISNTTFTPYLSDITTNTNYLTSLDLFLRDTTNTSLLVTLSTLSSFYTFTNIFKDYTTINTTQHILSNIPEYNIMLSSYPSPVNNITPVLSCVISNTTRICGYFLPSNRFTALTKNIITVNLPYIQSNTFFDIVITTPLGWTSTQYLQY
jgi:hypothetical protein